MGSYLLLRALLAVFILDQRASSSTSHGVGKTLDFTLFQHEGLNRTGYIVVNGVGGAQVTVTTFGFGGIYVASDPLTTEPNASPEAAVGLAEGASISTSMEGFINLYIATCTLNVKDHKGSISLLGRTNNRRPSVVPVVGGTGDFMYVQGYVNSYPVDLRDIQRAVYGVDFHLFWPASKP